MAGKFEVYKDRAGKFRFRLKASNGQVVATGEAYETKAAAKKGCESVLRAATGGRHRSHPPRRWAVSQYSGHDEGERCVLVDLQDSVQAAQVDDDGPADPR